MLGIVRTSAVLALIAATSVAAPPATQTRPPAATRPSIRIEAEAAELHGTLYATTRPGYSGDGYVTGFDADSDRLTFTVDAPSAGLYQIELRYSSPLKGFDLHINGVTRSLMFPDSGDAFATRSGGKVELKAGPNVIEIRKGWGHYDIDRLELFPTELAPVAKPPATPVNPDATPEARALLQKLVDAYGKTTLSGVTNQKDADLVQKVAGVYPTLRGGDLIDYSPSRMEHNDKLIDPTESMIERAKAGDVLTLLWHWNAPAGLLDKMGEKDGKPVDLRWYRGFYTEATTFDVAAALDDPAGPNYALLLRDIDAIAVQLKKYQAAGIPILWRPLHEADGKWFWWGAKGSAPFKRLWSLLYDRLTHHHHLNNLIWVYTASDNFEWFPPDDQFDVIGVDLYPTDMHDPASPIWDALQARYGGKKMLAIAEFGGVPDLDAMAKLGVRWSYFCSWGGKLGPEKPSPEELKRLYHAPTIATR